MNGNESHPWARSPDSIQRKREPGFAGRVLIVFAIGAAFLFLVALLWFASTVVLLVFSSVLVAVLLCDASGFVERRLRLSHGLALAAVLLLVVGLLALWGWLLAPSIVAQTQQLIADLPNAAQRLRDFLEQHEPLKALVRALPSPQELLSDASALATRAGTVFSGVLGGVGHFVFIIFVAIYLAAQPGVYTRGLVKLIPPNKRGRGKAVLDELGKTLTLWLRGKLISMAVIGTTTAIGLTLLDVPLALALGMVAGLFDFIPYIGPLLAAVPALLIAFSQSPALALYVLILFVAVQSIEAYLLSPLIDRKMVSLPPALTITMQVLMGLTFGLGGVALATPLTAAITVVVAMLYVEDTLDDEVRLPGGGK